MKTSAAAPIPTTHSPSMSEMTGLWPLHDKLFWHLLFPTRARNSNKYYVTFPENLSWTCFLMMTSSNGNIFRVTGPLCGEFTGPGEFPTQRPVTWSFDVFFDLPLNKWLSKQPWSWWFETPLWSLRRQCNVSIVQQGLNKKENITHITSFFKWLRFCLFSIYG